MLLDKYRQYCLFPLFCLILQSCGQSHQDASSVLGPGSQEPRRPDGTDIEETIKYLTQLPREDLSNFEELKKYEIYYSITTSPARLPNVHYVLDTLDLSVPKKVFIVLPEKYRNKEEYSQRDIDKIKEYSVKIEILRPKEDLGPSMKLIPAVETVRGYLGSSDRKIVVTFDDDTGYPAGLPMQLIKHSILHRAAVGASGRNASFFCASEAFPRGSKTSSVPCKTDRETSMTHCDVLEGFQGIAYPVDKVDTDRIAELAHNYETCRFGDDFLISYVLGERSVNKILVKNKYTENLIQFKYGFLKDALHKTDLHGNSSEDLKAHFHGERYAKCLDLLNAHVWMEQREPFSEKCWIKYEN